MPIVVNNNFSEDTYGIRAERLNAIQGNFTLLQPALNAQAPVVTWSTDCYDIFTNLVAVAGVEMNESEGATLDAGLKGELMEEEYQNAKLLANTIFRNDQVHLKDFGFDIAFPDNRNDKIARVDKVLEAHTRHVAATLPALLPAAIITRLTDARDAYVAALKNQDKERSDARVAVANLSKQFEADTRKLQDLRAWSYAMLGKHDPRMGLIGMVNPDSGGNSGSVPGFPVDRAYDHNSHVFSWSVVPDATSYQVECAFDDGNDVYVNFYDGPETHALVDPGDGGWYLRIRARDSNGFGEWSPTMYIGYTNFAPQNLVPHVTYGANTQVTLNFQKINGVAQYRLFLGYGPLGSTVTPALTGSVIVTDTPITVPTAVANQRYFMALKCYNEGAYGIISQIVSVDVNGLTA